MIKKTVLIAMLLTANISAANASQTKGVKDGDEVSANISLSELNRIKVVGDKITSLKTNQGDLEVLEEAALGEIYIKPLHNNKEQISLFIITKKGKTYKLSLRPQDIGAQQIFLTKKSLHKPLINQKRQDLAAIFKAFQNKNKKFNAADAPSIEDIEVNGYELNLVKSEVIGELVAEVYSFYNRNSFFAELDPEELLSANRGRWISISVVNQSPSIGEYSTIYILREKK